MKKEHISDALNIHYRNEVEQRTRSWLTGNKSAGNH